MGMEVVIAIGAGLIAEQTKSQSNAITNSFWHREKNVSHCIIFLS